MPEGGGVRQHPVACGLAVTCLLWAGFRRRRPDYDPVLPFSGVQNVDPSPYPPFNLEAGSVYTDAHGPPCPKFGGPTLIRRNRGTRSLFWGCQKFRTGGSRCDGVANLTLDVVVRIR